MPPAAMAELRRRFLFATVYAAGLRLGASVAGWPGSSTADWMDSLSGSGVERSRVSGRHHRSRERATGGVSAQRSGTETERPGVREIVGYPMTEAMYGIFRARSVCLTRVPASRTLLVDSSDEQSRRSCGRIWRGSARASAMSTSSIQRRGRRPLQDRGAEQIIDTLRAGCRIESVKKEASCSALSNHWSRRHWTGPETKGAPAVILLNSGIIHRVGPNP